MTHMLDFMVEFCGNMITLCIYVYVIIVRHAYRDARALQGQLGDVCIEAMFILICQGLLYIRIM